MTQPKMPRRIPVVAALVTTLIANLIVIAQAVYFDWEIGTLVWAYWFESILLALISFQLTQQERRAMFAGPIIAVLAIGAFLYVNTSETSLASGTLALAGVVWVEAAFAGALFGVTYFIQNYRGLRGEQDNQAYIRLGSRIVPLFLIIAAAAFLNYAVIIFMIVKAAADLISVWMTRPGAQYTWRNSKIHKRE